MLDEYLDQFVSLVLLISSLILINVKHCQNLILKIQFCFLICMYQRWISYSTTNQIENPSEKYFIITLLFVVLIERENNVKLYFQQKYGDIFSITLGSSKCIVINDAESVKEVLIAKGAHFDGRPDFKRFDMLFGGDKQNCKSSSNFWSIY